MRNGVSLPGIKNSNDELLILRVIQPNRAANPAFVAEEGAQRPDFLFTQEYTPGWGQVIQPPLVQVPGAPTF